MKRSILDSQFAAAIASPLAQRVAVTVFLAIIFIEVVILIPSYSKRETDLMSEVSDLATQVVRMEFHGDKTLSRAEAASNAAELLKARHFLGVGVLEKDELIAVAGDTDGGVLIGGGAPEGALDGVPFRKLAAGRMEILLAKDANGLTHDVVVVADVSHIPDSLKQYVLRIGGLVVLISAFVTLVTMVVLWQTFLKRTLALSERMQDVAGNFTEEVKLPLSQTRKNDEIGALWRSFGSMIKTIRDSVSETEDLARFPSENPSPIIRCEPDGKIMYANDAAREIAGFFDSGDTETASAEVRAKVGQAYAKGRQVEFEVTFGSHAYSCFAVPVASRNYVNIYARDVSELKYAEAELLQKSADLEKSNEALKATLTGLEVEIANRTRDLVEANDALQKQMLISAEAETRFRAFAASAADWYWEMDKDLRFSFISEGFERVTGTRPSNIIGKRREEMGIEGVDDDEWRKHLNDLDRHRPFRNFVYPRPGPDGSTVYLSINGIPIEGDDGTFYGYRGTGSDVTVIREASEELRRAKEMAERAAKARSDFLATMSHEIRTPMNGIIGMSELLRETQLADDQRVFSDTILSSAKGLLQILNDILDLAKFESGGFDLEHISFSLAELVEGVIEPISLQAAQRGNNLAVVLDPKLPWSVAGDPHRLRQVLLNLVGNAVKFTEDGEITVEIVEQYRGANGVTILFDVRDTGIGISAENQERLFKDFSQVDQSITRRYGGTGLGLSISKRLVDLMGGSIGVSSVLGQGSSFRFALQFPVVQQEAPADETMFLKDVRAAVVDDNDVNLRVMSGYLDGFGVSYALFDDPAVALKTITDAANSEASFDVVFLDYNMPGMDGVDLAERLTASIPEKSLPKRMLLSSLALTLESGRGPQGLFDAKVMKPVTRKTLIAGLRAAFGNKSAVAGTVEPVGIGHIGTPRLLLAEDNPINARIAISMLQNLGCEVDVASDGEEAVDAAAFVPYDLILMDIHMPKMGGIEAATVIKDSGGGNAATPILAVTADVMLDIGSPPMNRLFVGTLTKPYTAQAMHRALIDSLADDKRSTAGQGVPNVDAPGDVGLDRAIVDDLINQLGVAETLTIVQGVESDLKQFEDDLKDCREDGTEAMASAAHVRAGTCAATGLVALTQALRALERAARGADLDDWDARMKNLPGVVEASKAEIVELIEELSEK